MKESHETLHHYLQKLEAGLPLDEVLDGLPAEHVDLAGLISIAQSLRLAPEPACDAAAVAARDKVVFAAIRERAAEPPRPEEESGWIWSGWRNWRLPTLHFIPQFQFSGGLITLLVIFVASWAFFMRDHSSANAFSATLDDGAGRVEVTSLQSDTWRALEVGERVGEGQRVRTGAASTATLAFFEGSALYLAPDSAISFIELGGEDESLIVEIDQDSGRTAHDVVPLHGEVASYIVRTPGGTATVHGTSFSVHVGPSGDSQFAVNEGEVTVAAAGKSVVLYGGQVSLVNAGTPPSEPEQPPRPSLSFEPDELETSGCQSQFTFSGGLRNDGSEEKDVAADVALSHSVLSGEDLIESISIEPSSWATIVPGEAVSFDASLSLVDGWESAPEGTEIKIRVFVSNESNWPDHHQTRLTLTGGLRCTQNGTPTTSITATTTLTATPTITPTGTVTGTATVTPTPTVTGTPTITGTVTVTPQPTATPGGTTCTESDPHPEATRLAERHGVPYEEIMGWFCAGFGFGEIDIAYSLAASTGRSVGAIFDMRTSGMGWGQIRQELGDLPGGPPDGAGPPDDVGPPDGTGPPDGAGPPKDVGPPDGAGPPDDVGPPEEGGPPDGAGPPGDGGDQPGDGSP